MIKFLVVPALVTGTVLAIHFATDHPAKCDPGLLTFSDTPETIRYKCGNPSYINATLNHEQWVYTKGFPEIGGTYIYVDNGYFSSAQWEKQ